MGKLKLIFGIAFVALLFLAGAQILPPLLANYELQDDLHDVAALGGARVGLIPQTTDQSLQDTVIHRATEHGIRLEPEQVIVRREGVSGGPSVYLEVRYKVTVNLLGYTFDMNFHPSSGNKG